MKALIVCTSHQNYPSKTTKTGLWLSELTHFYDKMIRHRVIIDIISTSGGNIPIDERSIDLKDQINEKYYNDPAFTTKIQNSLSPEQIDPLDYRLVYFAGGHGAMWDFPQNTALQEITKVIYENQGTVSAVCHGVSALLNVRLSDGSLLINQKYITGFSNIEEALSSFVSETPFSLEDRLKLQGANYKKAMIPFLEFIEMDERLITGQNPNSAKKVASKALEELFEK